MAFIEYPHCCLSESCLQSTYPIYGGNISEIGLPQKMVCEKNRWMVTRDTTMTQETPHFLVESYHIDNHYPIHIP